MTQITNRAYSGLWSNKSHVTVARYMYGVTVTAQAGNTDCFVQSQPLYNAGGPLVLRVDVWDVTGDKSTLVNKSILIAELDPWKTLATVDARTDGNTMLVTEFTPMKPYVIRFSCPADGRTSFTQPLLVTKAEWDKLKQLGVYYFNGSTMPLGGGRSDHRHASEWGLAA